MFGKVQNLMPSERACLLQNGSRVIKLRAVDLYDHSPCFKKSPKVLKYKLNYIGIELYIPIYIKKNKDENLRLSGLLILASPQRNFRNRV